MQPLQQAGTSLAAYPHATPSSENLPDRYGIAGLLQQLNGTEPLLENNLLNDMDTQTLVMRFSSDTEYFKTFASPWLDHAVRGPHENKVRKYA